MGLLLCLDERKNEPVNTATGLWGIRVLSSGTRGLKEGFEDGSGGALTPPVLPVLENTGYPGKELSTVGLCISRVL